MKNHNNISIEMNSQHQQSRRKFVATAVGSGFLLIAGCTDESNGDSNGGTDEDSDGGTDEDDNDGSDGDNDDGTDGNSGTSYNPEQIRENAEYIEYRNLLRDVESYVGEPIHYPWGEVVQSISDSNQYRINVGEYPGFDSNDLFVDYSGDERLVEDDQIQLWGVVEGSVTYETVMGDERTIPRITLVDYEEFETVQNRDLNVEETYETPQGVSVTVLDIELQDSYEYEDYQEEIASAEPDTGNQWCFVVFESTNNSGSAEFIPFDSDISIVSNGSQFDSDFALDEPINRNEGAYEGGEVQDGISRTGWILYQIPDDLLLDDIEVVWSDSTPYVEWTISWSE